MVSSFSFFLFSLLCEWLLSFGKYMALDLAGYTYWGKLVIKCGGYDTARISR
jgi:hypothetical protein